MGQTDTEAGSPVRPLMFLVHRHGDDVGVAVAAVTPGPATGRVLLTGETVDAKVIEDIEFGHKFALHELPAGVTVTKDGVLIGRTTQPVARGAHVHVHNLRSLLWQPPH